MKYLIPFLFLLSCTKETLTPGCPELSVEQTIDGYIVWWLPDLDPIHSGATVYLDGELVRGMCRRDADLKITDGGKWSFFAETGQVVCIDRDAIVTENDCECENLIQ